MGFIKLQSGYNLYITVDILRFVSLNIQFSYFVVF